MFSERNGNKKKSLIVGGMFGAGDSPEGQKSMAMIEESDEDYDDEDEYNGEGDEHDKDNKTGLK